MMTIELDRQYTLSVHQGELPTLYTDYKQHAILCEEIEPLDTGDYCFFGIQKEKGLPQLCVLLRYPDASWLFSPGVLLVPETDVVFIGGGEKILAYDARTPRRLWQDHVEYFWGWHRYDDVILMSAELEFAAWSLSGEKLWSTFVEPPWDFEVLDGIVDLDVMGKRTRFPARTGPTNSH